MENREKEGNYREDNYIGDIYVEDAYAYAHMPQKEVYNPDAPYWETEVGVVQKVRAYKGGYLHFCWPAALTETLWYAYRGMIKEAVVFDAIATVLGGVLLHFSIIAFLVLMILLAIIKGFLAYPLYYIHMKNAVEQRGLLMRSAQESPPARESLAKEGKPSVFRAALYLFFKCFWAVCLDSILFSIFCMLGV